MSERFDLNQLDDDDPFEDGWDRQPHLVKHEIFDSEDVLDVFLGNPLYFPAREDGPAHWLMVGEVPGGDVLVVPLMPSTQGDVTRCRPIGVYRAGRDLELRYRDEGGERS